MPRRMSFRAAVAAIVVFAMLILPMSVSAHERPQGGAGSPPVGGAGMSGLPQSSPPLEGSPLSIAPDAYEPDNDAMQHRAITFFDNPAGENHTIDNTVTPDRDWFSFQAVGGTLYTFETSGTADTVLELYDLDYGEILSWSDDKDAAGGDFGSKVTWTAPDEAAGNSYYLIVSPANNVTGVGDYKITATTAPGGRLLSAMERVAGGDRYMTAEAVAREAFPGWELPDGSAVATVIVCNGEDAKAADPLAAASLAGVRSAPILLVKSTSVPAQTSRPLTQIRDANGGRVDIIVIGGTGTVSTTIYNALAKYKGSGTITRISGVDRYDLAAKISDKVVATWVSEFGGKPRWVLIANGESPAAFFDALASGPGMYRTWCPLLLVKGTSIPTSTKSRLSANFGASQRWVVNRAYVSSGVYSGVSPTGYITNTKNRYDAAYFINKFMVNRWWIPSNKYGVSNKLADSLTGGAAMGQLGGGLLFTGYDPLSDAAAGWLYWRMSAIDKVYVFGGTGSVSSGTYADISMILH